MKAQELGKAQSATYARKLMWIYNKRAIDSVVHGFKLSSLGYNTFWLGKAGCCGDCFVFENKSNVPWRYFSKETEAKDERKSWRIWSGIINWSTDWNGSTFSNFGRTVKPQQNNWEGKDSTSPLFVSKNVFLHILGLYIR